MVDKIDKLQKEYRQKKILTGFDVQVYHAKVVDVLKSQGDLEEDVFEFGLLEVIARCSIFRYRGLQAPTWAGIVENKPTEKKQMWGSQAEKA